MAVRAASPLTPFWFTPKDQEGDQPARFKIRGLKSLELIDVNAGAINSGDQVKWTSGSIRTALSAGLLGWEGFLDANGEPVEFGRAMEANLERVPFELMTELFGEIIAASALGVEQEKN